MFFPVSFVPSLSKLGGTTEAKQHADEKLSEAEEEDDEDAPSSPAETEEWKLHPAHTHNCSPIDRKVNISTWNAIEKG